MSLKGLVVVLKSMMMPPLRIDGLGTALGFLLRLSALGTDATYTSLSAPATKVLIRWVSSMIVLTMS